jgi:ABC-type antimicrobial peptide transport system permease subunit
LLGREITAQDSGSAERAAVVNETFAHRFFPNTNPIGKHIRDTYPDELTDCVVIGVVANAKYNSLREKTPPRIYAPLFNPLWAQNAAFYEVRTLAHPASVTTALRSVVQDVAPSVPPIHIRTMTGLVDDKLQTDRFVQELSSAFGVLAILLASIGLYGVLAYNVARRTREIGIRLALGAPPISIHRQVLRESLMLAVLGIALGVPAALGGTRLIRSLLFGLGFADPVVLVSAGVILLFVAAAAGFIPARRASRIDPIVALRYD